LLNSGDTLSDFYDPLTTDQKSSKSSGAGSPLATASASNNTSTSAGSSWDLHHVIDRVQRDSRRQRIELNVLNQRIDSQLVHCYQTETELLLQLLDLITNAKLKDQFKFDEFRRDFLRDRLHVLRARLSLLRYQLLDRTYTPANVAALQQTKKHLDAAERELADTHRAINDKLNDYKRVSTRVPLLPAVCACTLCFWLI
jgi:hypothetical protein